MSMPEFPSPNPDMTSEQALTMILSSIALEEVALSHIINAEGEKIQHVLNHTANSDCPEDTTDILAVNRSVTNMLEMVMQTQLLLKTKMDRVLEYLPKPPCPPEPIPPCPPEPIPPCPPDPSPPPCPPDPPPPPCLPRPPICFGAMPGCYMRGEALEWTARCGCGCGRFAVSPEDETQICLPRTGEYTVNLIAEFCPQIPPEEAAKLELVVHCGEKTAICRLLCDSSSNCQGVCLGNTVIRMPCACEPCYAGVFLHSPGRVQLKRACLTFTPL